MNRKQAGFTLIEMLIVIGIMGFVLAATTDTFVSLLRAYKQQSKVAETNIEGIIGLELMRQDIERAGFGIPWVMPSNIAYTEAAGSPGSNYNDCAGAAPCSPPKPILSGPDGWSALGSGIANSDYLVIKATNIARNARTQLWTYMTTSEIKQWTPASENLQNSDYVITLSPGTGGGNMRTLETAGAKLGTVALPNASDLAQPKFVFVVSPDTVPLRPFNRADYVILAPGTTNKIPSRCAPNSGVLVKEVLNQGDGGYSDILPLLDCVADMRVLYRLDTNGDGIIDAVQDNLAGVSAGDIRAKVKEVRVYILAQEGQKDTSYTSPASIYVGDPSIGSGHTYNLGTNVNYRWKLYSIVVQPKNMRQSTTDKG